MDQSTFQSSFRKEMELGTPDPNARWFVHATHSTWEDDLEYQKFDGRHYRDGHDGTLTLEVKIPRKTTKEELRELLEKMRAIGFEFV